MSLSSQEMLFLTDISKTVIPLFAALGGAMTGSYLTYRFQRKDKIRDHLFTYKVKSYSAIAETILNSKREYDKLIHSIYFAKEDADYLKNPEQLYSDLYKTISENTLFISKRTKIELNVLEKQFSNALEAYVFNQIERISPRYPKDVLLKIYENTSKECLVTIEKLQEDLQVYRIESRKH